MLLLQLKPGGQVNMKLKTKEDINEGIRKFMKQKPQDWSITNPPKWRRKE